MPKPKIKMVTARRRTGRAFIAADLITAEESNVNGGHGGTWPPGALRAGAGGSFWSAFIEEENCKSLLSKRMNTEFASLFKLGRAERLQLVEDLWDSIAPEDEQMPLPDWKPDELRRRKQRFLQHPDPASGRTRDQVKQRARAQHD
jgi:putative addiction module component (TIGR02574 family)